MPQVLAKWRLPFRFGPSPNDLLNNNSVPKDDHAQSAHLAAITDQVFDGDGNDPIQFDFGYPSRVYRVRCKDPSFDQLCSSGCDFIDTFGWISGWWIQP